MKIILTKAGIMHYSCFCFSQNLVSNPSFETYSNCPSTGGQIFYAYPWFNPDLSNNATPDYYNQCSGIMNVPNTPIGFQYARTGVAYAGIFVFYPPPPLCAGTTDSREYIECELMDSLRDGKKYCVEFFVSSPQNKYAVNSLGAYFSDTIVYSYNNTVLPYQPQIKNPDNNTLGDTLNWMQIYGEFVAQGGEKYITIGNFNNDSTTPLDTVLPSGACTPYYYIDDVSVYCCDNANTQIELGNNITICKGDSITIGLPQVAGYYYRWSSANGLYINDTSIAQPIVKPTVTTTYFLFIEDTAKKQSCNNTATDSVTVYVIEPTEIDAVGLAGEDTMLCAESNNGAVLGKPAINGYEYSWQPVQYLNNPNTAQPFFSSTSTSTLTLTITDTTALCKTGNDTVTVSVVTCDTIPNIVYVPNIFSPNGDGSNDYFRVQGANIVEGELSIYNRWGERIWDLGFGIGDLKDETKWWNGTYKGKLLNTGVFVYFCRVTYTDGTSEEKKGNVTLVR